jgi:uncharacterized protein (DUF486 family)
MTPSLSWPTLAPVVLLSLSNVFCGFSVFFLHEALTWNHLIGFALIAAGAAVVFLAPIR